MSATRRAVSADKSVLSRLGPLTAQQRADLQALINGGIDPATARAIVQSGGLVSKSERPTYHQAYVAQAKKTLPDWQHQGLHQHARAVAGGHAAAKARLAPDPSTARLQEMELLTQRLAALQEQIDKGTMTASQAHVPVPLGSDSGNKKRRHDIPGTEGIILKAAIALVAKADFDESKHPRDKKGEFGQGASGVHLQAANRHAQAASESLDRAKQALGSADSVAFEHHMKMARKSHKLNRDALARASQSARPVGPVAKNVSLDIADAEAAYVFVSKEGFDEAQHPRDAAGEFASSASGGAGAKDIIGHTQSGKPVHDWHGAKNVAYAGFTQQDHKDAAKIQGASATYQSDARKREHITAAKKMAPDTEPERGIYANARTSSGKRIYEDTAATHSTYKRYTGEDHLDAAQHHNTHLKENEERPDLRGEYAQKQRARVEGHLQKAQQMMQPQGVASLPGPQENALAGYTGHDRRGANHDILNNALEGRQQGLPQEHAKILSDAAHLNTAIANSPLAKETTFYRGTNMPEEVHVGQIIKTPRLLSVSTSKEIAHRFATEEDYAHAAPEHPAVLTMHAPAGTPALDVNKHFFGVHAHEKEHILASNQAFRVTGVTVEDGVRHVSMDAVGSADKAVRPAFVRKSSAMTFRHDIPAPDSARKRMTSDVNFQLVGPSDASPSVRKAVDAETLAHIQAAYDLLAPVGAYEPDARKVPEGAEGLMQANRLVAGMDAEMAAGATSAEDARRRASRALYDRPGLYDGIGSTHQTDRLQGLQLDLGCGTARAPGFIGLDLGTFGDYGVAIHDLSLGLPEFVDGSVKAVRLVNAWQPILDSAGEDADPAMLLKEIQRVMCEGAILTYVGPEPLFTTDSAWPAPGLFLMGEMGIPASDAADGAGAVHQTFERVPPRVPAYHGADADYQPAGPQPIEDALAMAESNAAPARLAMANLIHKTKPKGLSKSALVHKTANRVVKIAKMDNDKRIVIGVVLEPMTADAQGDILTPEDIEEAAHGYLGTSRVIGSEHGAPIEAYPVESYIAPQDLIFDGPTGRTQVTKGSWVLGVKVNSPEEWVKVRQNNYNAFSVGGFGVRENI